MRFFEPDDGPFDGGGPDGRTSVWAWQPHIKAQILQGIGYWANVLQLQGDQGPAVLNVGTDSEEGNAFGYSPPGLNGKDSRTLLQRHFQGLPVAEEETAMGAHGIFGLGPSSFAPEYRFTQIPLTGYDDLVSTAIHELAHGLGASSEANRDDGNEYKPRFLEVLQAWAPLMVDDNGRPARPGQAILCDFCEHPYDPDAFDARNDRSVLIGPNIAEVLEGGLPGVPLSMYVSLYGGPRGFDDNNMSHSELANSMMSHQNYRNYTGFMEAELAVLQDIGYTIDRRNFFGRSVYGSGLDIVNDRGFYARNPAGTAYVVGQPNKAVLGLGLHVYGSHNRIRQVADLLADGEGGAGIRVDGEGNSLTIDRGVRVQANGLGGQGVMFTYGRNHTLVHRGDVEALGSHGVGLRFDFGDNVMMNSVEHRGSYIHTIRNEPVGPAPELCGPLVSSADITGRVAGREAAIYMGQSAYVGSVNLMQGARIEGDIVSHYAQRDEAGAPRLTRVSFGQAADAQGRATGRADAGFFMAYDGGIRGRENLALSFDGGTSVLGGRHEIHSVAVRPHATLAGTGAYALADAGEFVNEGVMAPGNSIGTITVDGAFRQAASGRLHTEFNSAGAHDVVAVSGTIDLAGTLQLQPLEGWYDSAWNLDAQPVQGTGARTGAFDTVTVAHVSPTLSFAALPTAQQGVRLSAVRAADAYSRYGADDNARAAGRVIDAAAGGQPGEMRPFVQAMDFSTPDGSDVARALDQASPQGYSAGLAASLMRERDVMDSVLRGFGEGLRNAPGSEWRGFAVAFGGEGRQNTHDTQVGYDATTYGLVIGGGRRLASNPDLAVGVHLDIAEQSVNLKSPQWGKGKTTAFGLGAQLQYRPDVWEGTHAHAGFRLGVEQGSMDRKIGVRDYYAAHSADWTGHSASVEVGGGYRWRLSPAASAGPVFALNYARVSRPGVEESGPAATRLLLESRNADALRSSLGVGALMRHELQNGSTLCSHAQITWDHEWMDRDVVQTASFAAAPGSSFQSRNAVLPRDSVGLRAGLTWQRSERFSLGVGVGGRVGSDYKSLEGQLSLRWAF